MEPTKWQQQVPGIRSTEIWHQIWPTENLVLLSLELNQIDHLFGAILALLHCARWVRIWSRIGLYNGPDIEPDISAMWTGVALCGSDMLRKRKDQST